MSLTSVVTVVVGLITLVIGASISVYIVNIAKIIVATHFMTANRNPFAKTSVFLSG